MNKFINRKYIIGSIIIIAAIILLVRLFDLQILDPSYKSTATSNVLRKETQFPARGLIYDRNGELLVYNQAAYDLMVVPNLVEPFDTVDFCNVLAITKEELIERLNSREIRQHYYQASAFIKQISSITFAVLQEKLYKYPGFLFNPEH